MIPHLVVVSGDVDSVARSIPLCKGRVLIIGRGSSSDFRVPEPNVARRQCDIELRGGTAWLLDYGYTRGERFGETVHVNGRPVGAVENFWPQAPIDYGAEPTPAHLDRVVEQLQQQHDKLIWHPLQSGDEIRVGTAVFRLETSMGTESEDAQLDVNSDSDRI